ncbi:MAG: hypothetical protein KDA57_22670 [Planctomycetales bacterium]|nr:hypothetical protein [Planctomycetales bacterium]
MTRRRRIVYWAILIALVLFVVRVVDLAAGLFLPDDTRFSLLPPSSTWRDHRGSWDYVIRTNRLGLRGPEITSEAEQGPVYFLGDSFTFGLGVAEEQTFVGQIRRSISETTVVNGGIVDYGPRQALAQLRALGPAINPRIVVYCLYTNDVYDAGPTYPYTRALQGARKKLFIDLAFYVAPNLSQAIFRAWYAYRFEDVLAPQNDALSEENASDVADPFVMSDTELLQTIRSYAMANDVPPDRFASWLDRLGPGLLHQVAIGQVSFVHLGIGLLIPDYYSQALDLGPVGRPKFERLCLYVQSMRAESERLGARFILVYLPSELQFDEEKQVLNARFGHVVRREWLTSETALQRSLALFARQESIPFYDLTSQFRVAATRPGPRLVFDEDLHYSAAGHSLVAATLIPIVRAVRQ